MYGLVTQGTKSRLAINIQPSSSLWALSSNRNEVSNRNYMDE